MSRTIKTKLAAILALAVALGLVAQSPAAAGEPADGTGIGTIVASHSGKCLEIAGASLDDFAPAQQFTCNGRDHQQWLRGEEGTLMPAHSRKCLEPVGIIALGASVFQLTCWEENPAQQFEFVAIAQSGNSLLVNIVQPATRLCLSVQGASLADGAGIAMLTCDDSAPNQTWIIRNPLIG
ncbi:MAG TPA: RICIN domain-containing protein [Candidatus Limnocylindrales bacterium]|nr:RICIN domain-containing protein [Candidatus Limnocylindrales bacterium]